MGSLCRDEKCRERPQRVLRAFLEREGIAYIDYLPLMRFYAEHRRHCFLDPERDLYWRLDGHWSPRGNHLVGLLLTRFLVREGLLEVPDPSRTLEKIEEELLREFGKLPPEELWREAIYIPKGKEARDGGD